jgi:hypothetical protein
MSSTGCKHGHIGACTACCDEERLAALQRRVEGLEQRCRGLEQALAQEREDERACCLKIAYDWQADDVARDIKARGEGR